MSGGGRSHLVLRSLGVGLAGLAQAASIAMPWGRWQGEPLWWLQILSLGVLVWLLDGQRFESRPRAWRSASFLGGVFGTAWLGGTFWWLFVSMHTYGGMAAPLAGIATLSLAVTLALYYAAACGCFVALAPAHRAVAAIVFVAFWMLAELLRGTWFTGFPWGAGGYAHVEGPLAAYASWLGVYGVGAVASGVAALLALALRHRARPAARATPSVLNPPRPPAKLPGEVLGSGAATLWLFGCALVLLATPAAIGMLGAQRGAAHDADLSRGRLSVALLQGNIPQDEKFVPGGGVATALRWYGEQLQAATAQLVVTPETALPLLPAQLPPGYLAAIAERYSQGAQAALVGLPLGEANGQGGYTNSVLGFRPGQAQPYRYDKHHLVPFGEFIPPLFRWFIDLMQMPLGDFDRGPLVQPSFAWQGQRIAPNICYEDLFGEEIGARFRHEASAPTVLLNMSNIGWFGDTIAIDQHLAISRMRALEFARPVVRATNTGATAVIDHHGRVTAALPRLTRGVLVAEFEGRGGLTFYARWVSRFGLAPLWIAAALVAFAALVHRRRSGRPGP